MATNNEMPSWYKKDIGSRLKPLVRTLFEEWAGFKDEEELEKHLHKIRDQAWKYGNYPCVGLWVFVMPSIAAFPQFPALIEKLKSIPAPTILDLGAGFGQDLRMLAWKGIPTTNMWATDKESDFYGLGYELFRDKQKMTAHFVEADFLADKPSLDAVPTVAAHHGQCELGPLEALQGKVDLVVANQFYHLFDKAGQFHACIKTVAMSKPGTTIIGYQVGRPEAQEVVDAPWGKLFFNTESTWRQLWKDVESTTKTRWDVDVRTVDLTEWGTEKGDFEWWDGNFIGLNFVITRVE